MYFIECVLKKIFDRKKKKKDTSYDNIPPVENMPDKVESNDVINCNHNFMPIDSSGEVFACSKCGYLIKKEDMAKAMKNPFAQKGF